LLLLGAIIAFLVWLLLIRPDDTHHVPKVGGGPVAASQSDLAALSRELGQPVYWGGPMPGTSLELTVTGSRNTYVRYLTGGARVGDPSPEFPTIGTYPVLNAYRDLQSYARSEHADTRRIAHRGLAMVVPGSPTSVFFAYPRQEFQVEVYDARQGRALDLVTSGAIKPVVLGAGSVAPGVQQVTPKAG